MRFWSKIKFKLAKRRVRLRNRMTKPFIPNEKEQKAINIVKTLIKDETSVMLVAPLSKKRYIKNERRQMFVIMEDVNLTLASSKYMYYYDLTVNDRVASILSKNFDNVLESRRNVMEKEMIQGVTSNLDFISKHMNDDIEEEK
jgi:hypothetical protein